VIPAIEHNSRVVMLSSRKFLFGCGITAAAIFFIAHIWALPTWLLALEVFATVISLFVFGSFKYHIHKNAITYGMLLVILATFSGLPDSRWHEEIRASGWWVFAREHLLSFKGLDSLIHADTMLFILGLTFFVAVVAQTRLLEGITFFLLRRFKGRILPTVLAVTAVVAIASGILDGVSMIGLTIRTLVIILLLSAAPTSDIRHAVMICTTVTTVCGIWLAYGEPPNLIMKSNLHPYLDDAFFLRYCAPAAIASYLVIAWQLRNKLSEERIDLDEMDVIDANAEDVRFLQALRHGEVLTPIELIELHERDLADKSETVLMRLHKGESLGLALIRSAVPEAIRKKLLAHFVSEELADSLDRHYLYDAAEDHVNALKMEKDVDDTLYSLAQRRRLAQKIAAFALVPFIALLILHGINHDVPLFLASFAGFFVALLGIVNIPKMRTLAIRDARHEFAEYYFLLPLFLSITLLTEAGFFDHLKALIRQGTGVMGYSNMALAQFFGSTFLSAILDNNVVADFASRALHDLDLSVMHLFALAQIAGYAVGGCWTNIGSAQSVVAFAFIKRNVDEHYTPLQWVKEMTPVILEILAVLTILIYIEGMLLSG
jgi:Na+/H+ antiporter NhaD/arsenite permease-like protein